MTAEETLRRLTDAGLVASGSYGPVFDPTAIVALLDRLTALDATPAPDAELERLRRIEARITTLVNQGPHWSPHPDIRYQVPTDPDWGASLVSVADIRAALTEPSHD